MGTCVPQDRIAKHSRVMDRPWPSSNNIGKQQFVITHQLEENIIKHYRVGNSKVGSFKLKHFFSST